MADLVWETGFQFPDDSGNPLNAGTLNIYDAGTLSTRTVYQDSGETVPWTQPITFNSAGRAQQSGSLGPIYVPSGTWKFILKNSAGSTIATQDNIPGAVTIPSATYAAPRTAIVTKAVNYTVVVGDLGKKFEVDASGGTVTITLVTAASAQNGDWIIVQNVGATGNVIIDGSGAQTINGSLTHTLKGRYDWVLLQTDGANWKGMIEKRAATVSTSTDYTVTLADRGSNVVCDASGGAIAITLPTVASAQDDFEVTITKSDSSVFNIVIDGNGAELINGVTTRNISRQWGAVQLRCTGAAWHIIAESEDSIETAQIETHAVTAPKIGAGVSTGLLHGLTLSNNAGDATNDIDIAAGKARDSTDTDTMTLAASITKRLDAAWAVGDGNGGLDSGSIANATYHVWLIKRSDTGVVDALFSTSSATPTMPTDYDLKRRIGAIIRSGGAIVEFAQDGDRFLKKVPTSAGSADPGTSAVLNTLGVPTGIRVDAIVSVILFAADAFDSTSYCLVTSPDQTDTAASSSLYDLSVFSEATGNIAGHAASQMRVRTNTSAQIRSRLSASSADISIRFTVQGWVDTRGRDA